MNTVTEPFTHTESCVEHLMGVAFLRTAFNSNVSTVPIQLVLACADALRELNTIPCPTGQNGCAKLELGRIETELTRMRKQLRLLTVGTHPADVVRAHIESLTARRTAIRNRRTAIRNLIGA